MREGIHPRYREVLFYDYSAKQGFVTRSTIETKETMEWEGKEYPCAKIEISSYSHPFYTGQNRMLDTEGRVEKFRKRYGAKK